MPAHATNLVSVEDLDRATGNGALAEADVDALRAVAHWIKTFVAKPHEDLGRSGPVCPFVPVSLERNTLWLAAEKVAGRSVSEIAEVVGSYHRLFLDAQPTEGDGAIYKSFVIVFTDLPADRAGQLFDDVLGQIAVPSYAENGFVMGGFFEGNQGAAIYNATFRPFTSPVPFLLVRQAVTSDWKFFLDNEELFPLWAKRYGTVATEALAEQLRRLPWREAP
jgi:hypothetical protein